MSDDIDWSKAPEGATHYNAHCKYPWLRDDLTVAYFIGDRGWRNYSNINIARNAIYGAVPRPTPQPDRIDRSEQPWHSDDAALQDFATAQSRRLAQCRAAGRSGWDDPEQCPPARLAEGLVRAMRAGKLVDVGNYAMMLWKRADQAQAMARVPGWIGEALSRCEPVEWDGTGLPPVGTMVGVHYSDQAPYEALVVAEHLGEVVLWIGNGARTNYWRCDPAWLRPILTPEQRAAKERDEAVAAMLADAAVVPFGSEREEDMARALYAAGWRKTEGE